MKKSHRFDEMSKSVVCKKCGKAIKQRLVEQKERPPKYCFACHTNVKQTDIDQAQQD